jgi:hypothetical protein
MTNWPEYLTMKRVRAAKIVNQERDAKGDVIAIEVSPDGEFKEWFQTKERGMMDRVSMGDYAIEYPDGFKSASPAANFEASAIKLETEDGAPVLFAASLSVLVDFRLKAGTAEITTRIATFTSFAAADAWVKAQANAADWSIMPVHLDPDPA